MTRSSKKGTAENANWLRFEGKIGEEQVFLHAEKDCVDSAADSWNEAEQRNGIPGAIEMSAVAIGTELLGGKGVGAASKAGKLGRKVPDVPDHDDLSEMMISEAELRKIQREGVAPKRVTPKTLGLNSISENQRLVSMWTDSLKHLNAAQTKGGEKYRSYLDAMANGNVTKDVARSAYEEVAVQFRKRLKAARNKGETFEGYNFERIHHWNWPIGDFPADATNAKKLFPMSHDRHMDTHRAATLGPHPTNSPIDPINIMDEPPQSLLPDNYFKSD